MALLMAGLVLYGFSFTIDKRLIHATPPKPWIVYLHAVVFFAWVALFIAQTALAAGRAVAWHRRLGVFGIALGACIPFVGVATAIASGRIKAASGEAARLAAQAFLVIPLNDMVCFAILFSLAVSLRRKPEYHRRLMFLAACGLTAAAYPRMPMVTITALRWYGGVDAIIALGVFRDLLRDGSLHIAYRYALAPLITMQTITMAIFIFRPLPWMQLAGRLIG